MSIAKKCDRCGALYEPYGSNHPVECNGFCSSYIGPAGGVWNHKTIDLCPECMAEFRMLTDEPKAQVFVIDQIIEAVNTCINHDSLTSECIRKELSNQRASWMPDVKGDTQE